MMISVRIPRPMRMDMTVDGEKSSKYVYADNVSECVDDALKGLNRYDYDEFWLHWKRLPKYGATWPIPIGVILHLRPCSDPTQYDMYLFFMRLKSFKSGILTAKTVCYLVDTPVNYKYERHKHDEMMGKMVSTITKYEWDENLIDHLKTELMLDELKVSYATVDDVNTSLISYI